MKKSIFFMSLCLGGLFAISCSDSTSDEFEEVNGNVEEKLIQSLFINSPNSPSDNKVISLSYNADGSLNTISSGEETSILVYTDNQLTNLSGGGDTFNIEELFNSPYDAFETGQVLEYDANGNPKTIVFFEEEYDYNSGEYGIEEYTAVLNYDAAPNPYYYTLESAGIISALDKVKLNFSLIQATELVRAKTLFPLNNPSQIIYKNEKGEIMLTMNANYDYDSDNYPKSATLTSVDSNHNETTTLSLIYSYVN